MSNGRKKILRTGWEGFVLAPCVRVPKGTGAHLEKKRGQHEESVLLMDLATSGVARELQKTHVCGK